MKPAKYDLTIYCGTTVDEATLKFIYKVGGVPVDLTGFTARSQGRGPHGLVFNATTENGKVVLGADGSISLRFTAEETTAMWRTGLSLVTPNLYGGGSWDLELVSADGRVVRLLSGAVLLSPEMTL